MAVELCLAAPLVAATARTATENFVTNKIAAAISQIPPPDFSTNNTELVETIEATAPAPGDYAIVSNRAMHAVQTETDPVWNAEKGDYATVQALENGDIIVSQANAADHADQASFATDANYAETANSAGYADQASFATDARYAETAFSAGAADTAAAAEPGGELDTQLTSLSSRVSLASSSATNYTDSATNAIAARIATLTTNVYTKAETDAAIAAATPEETDPTVPSWAKAAAKPAYTASEVGAASSSAVEEVRQDNAQTRQIVMTWETFLGGSNVVFSITNYLSGAYNLDAAKLRILELRDGEYHEVYNSRDEILLHIDDFSNRYVRVALDAIVDEVAERLASKADKDWGKYTSAGGEAPSNTVYMTAPNTVFAGGLEYERVAVGEGTICVLTTRGAPVWTQGDEGTFKFQDDGGTNYFGFAKTDSYTIGANTDGITVQGGMVTMNYNITMSGRPCVWYKHSLSSGAWEQLNLPDGSPVAGASHAVTWEANPDPGTQVCYINVGNAPSGFFRATVEVTGEAKFMTNMPADLSGGIISTNTATGVNGVVKPSFNGSSVIWTWSVN